MVKEGHRVVHLKRLGVGEVVDAAIKDNDEFSGKQVEVSRLAKPNGASYYLLKSSDENEVSSILIWCKQFKEYIGSADLTSIK